MRGLKLDLIVGKDRTLDRWLWSWRGIRSAVLKCHAICFFFDCCLTEGDCFLSKQLLQIQTFPAGFDGRSFSSWIDACNGSQWFDGCRHS